MKNARSVANVLIFGFAYFIIWATIKLIFWFWGKPLKNWVAGSTPKAILVPWAALIIGFIVLFIVAEIINLIWFPHISKTRDWLGMNPKISESEIREMFENDPPENSESV